MDEYPDFSSLAAREIEGRDYRIRIRDMGSRICIMAPHGGRIEPGTSAAAGQIAGNRFSWYCFEGIKATGNRVLHIPSHQFDEPRAVRLMAGSDVVVTVHACKDLEAILYLGGRFQSLGEAIRAGVENLGIPVAGHERFPGRHPFNICNLGRLKKGVQLELSRGLRDDPKRLSLVCQTIHKVLVDHDIRQENRHDIR